MPRVGPRRRRPTPVSPRPLLAIFYYTELSLAKRDKSHGGPDERRNNYSVDCRLPATVRDVTKVRRRLLSAAVAAAATAHCVCEAENEPSPWLNSRTSLGNNLCAPASYSPSPCPHPPPSRGNFLLFSSSRPPAVVVFIFIFTRHFFGPYSKNIVTRRCRRRVVADLRRESRFRSVLFCFRHFRLLASHWAGFKHLDTGDIWSECV